MIPRMRSGPPCPGDPTDLARPLWGGRWLDAYDARPAAGAASSMRRISEGDSRVGGPRERRAESASAEAGSILQLTPRLDREAGRCPEDPVKLGIQIPSFSWPGGTPEIGPTLARVARQADDIGVDSIWVMDHFFQIRGVGPAEEPMLEGWTALGYLAGHTERARLGLMVGGVHYRYPGLWVKAATTLDVLSGGRAWLGIGAAWNEDESR